MDEHLTYLCAIYRVDSSKGMSGLLRFWADFWKFVNRPKMF